MYFTASANQLTTAYEHAVAAYFPDTLPHVGGCAGEEDSAVFGCVLLTIYLGLFINFYFQTYKKPTAGGKPSIKSNGVANGAANGTRFGLIIIGLWILSTDGEFSVTEPSEHAWNLIYIHGQYKLIPWESIFRYT